MILYGKTVEGEIISAGHTGTDTQALQQVLGPLHDAALVVTAATGGTITLHGVSPEEGGDENGDRSFPLFTEGGYDAFREFLKRDRSAVGAAGHVIE